MEEIWKTVPDFEDYQVSNLGRIKSFKQNKNGKIIRGREDKDGYLMVDLRGRTIKKFKVHRLILSVFNPCENMDKLEVNHKNRIRTDNSLNNLEWVTHAQNMNSPEIYEEIKKKTSGILNSRSKPIQCIETKEVYGSVREAGRKLNIDSSGISRAIKRNGVCNNYHWKYITKEEYYFLINN